MESRTIVMQNPVTCSVLFTLPDELLLYVADYLHPHNVNALSQTCRCLNDKLTRYLYRMDSGRGKALVWAAGEGYMRTVQRFLRYKSPHHDIRRTGYTALIKACANGHADIVRTLLEVPVPRYALPNEPNESIGAEEWQIQPLLMAVRHNHINIVEMLMTPNTPIPQPLPLELTVSLLVMGTRGSDTTLAARLISGGLRVDVAVVHRLAARGKLALLRLLLLSGFNVNAATPVGTTALYYAVFSRDVAVVQLLLDAGAHVRGPDNNPAPHPLHAAAILGARDIVELLWQHGAPLDYPTSGHQHTALHLACERGFVDLVQFLLQVGASWRARDHLGQSPLDAAMAAGQERIIRLLVAAGAADTAHHLEELLSWAVVLHDGRLLRRLLRDGAHPHRHRDRRGQTALQMALRDGQMTMAQRLLDAGAPIDLADRFGQTPLMAAAVAASAEFLAPLLSRPDADSTPVDTDGRTVLHYAVNGNNRAVVPLLLHWAPGLLNQPDRWGLTPLMRAICLHHDAMAHHLLAHGARADLSDADNRSTLYWAVHGCDATLVGAVLERLGDRPDIVRQGGRWSVLHLTTTRRSRTLATMVLMAGADRDVRNELQQTPLLVAVVKGNLRMTRFWLDRGADPEARDHTGKTALFLAVCGGHGEIVQCLVAAGAQVNVLDPHGLSPLLWATMQPTSAIVGMLRAAGADGQLRGGNQRPALLSAAQYGRLGAVMLLLSDGGWDGAGSYDGRSALSLAAERGHYRVVRFLMQHTLGEAIDATDRFGRTALSWAVEGGYAAVVRALVEAGADVTRADYRGRTPLWWALHRGHEYLLRHLVGVFWMERKEDEVKL